MFARIKVNFPSLEGVKLVIGSAVTLQSVSRARFKSDHMQISIKCGGKYLESFFDLHQGWNLLGEKFLTIVMSLNDIDRGLDVCRKLSFYLLSYNR